MDRPSITLDTITIDCKTEDLPKMMDFYEKLTGFEAEPTQKDMIHTLIGKGIAISFFSVNRYTPPTFPSPEIGRQIHLDFYFTDLESAILYARSIGAKDSPKQFDDSYHIMFDLLGIPSASALTDQWFKG